MQPGDVVYTHHQTGGRGQRDAQWHCPEGQGLMASFVLDVKGLQADKAFWVGASCALAVLQVLRAISPDLKLSLKWPNDILAGSKKVGGMLLENGLAGRQLEWSVLGVGINLGQTSFPAHLPHGTSLHMEGVEGVKPEDLLQPMADALQGAMTRLRAGVDFREMYLRELWGIQMSKAFRTDRGREFGIPKGVDASGRLAVEINGQTRFFSVGELRWEAFL